MQHPDKVATLLVEAGCPPTRLVVEQGDLESYFLELVGMKEEKTNNEYDNIISEIVPALWVEFQKVRRSKTLWITALAFSLVTVIGGLFMFILKDPERARQSRAYGGQGTDIRRLGRLAELFQPDFTSGECRRPDNFRFYLRLDLRPGIQR